MHGPRKLVLAVSAVLVHVAQPSPAAVQEQETAEEKINAYSQVSKNLPATPSSPILCREKDQHNYIPTRQHVDTKPVPFTNGLQLDKLLTPISQEAPLLGCYPHLPATHRTSRAHTMSSCGGRNHREARRERGALHTCQPRQTLRPRAASQSSGPPRDATRAD